MSSRRPCLDPRTPVLERDDHSLQVGVDDPGVVLACESPRVLQRALRCLDGTVTVAQVIARTGVEAATLRGALAELDRHGLLGVPDPAPLLPLVRLIGSGLLGRTFAEAFVGADLGPLRVVDPGLADPDLYRDLRPSGAQTLKAHLRTLGATDVGVAEHWYCDGQPPAAFTVVACDTLECDRGLTDTLLREDQPHLFLRPLVDGVVVGPLVVPGRTPCTRCTDLVRAHDPCWPRVLAQLCRVRADPGAQLAAWAAQTALLQVQAWHAGAVAETAGSTLEIHRGTWTIEQRVWPRHPDCGCVEL